MNELPQFGKFTMLFDLIQTLAIAVLGFVMWVRKPGEQALSENDELAKRLLAIEEANKATVTREEFYTLREQMVRLEARYEGMQDLLKAQSATLIRIENFLLNQEGKA